MIILLILRTLFYKLYKISFYKGENISWCYKGASILREMISLIFQKVFNLAKRASWATFPYKILGKRKEKLDLLITCPFLNLQISRSHLSKVETHISSSNIQKKQTFWRQRGEHRDDALRRALPVYRSR